MRRDGRKRGGEERERDFRFMFIYMDVSLACEVEEIRGCKRERVCVGEKFRVP